MIGCSRDLSTEWMSGWEVKLFGFGRKWCFGSLLLLKNFNDVESDWIKVDFQNLKMIELEVI